MGDETKSRVARIPYTFQSTTGRGQTANGIKILADSFENYVESANFLEGIDHECCLHCINDGIISEEDPSSKWLTVKKGNVGGTTLEARESSNKDLGIVLYQIPHLLSSNGAETLDEYFKRIKKCFIAKYSVPWMGLVSTYVPDEWKDIMKRMIQFTLYLHKHDQSFANRLEKRNFILIDDKLKFCNLRVQKASTQSKIDDFGFVKMMIEELSNDFTEKNLKQILDTKTSKSKPESKEQTQPEEHPHPESDPGLALPYDLKDLLTTMAKYSDSRSDYILNHLAILSSEQRIRQIVGLKAKRAKLSPKEAALLTCNMTMRWSDWIVDFKKKCNPRGPVFKCFMHGCGDDNIPHYFGIGDKGKESLLFFCRNLGVHLQDYLIKDYPSFTDLDIDLTIVEYFGVELISFFQEANNMGVLKLLV